MLIEQSPQGFWYGERQMPIRDARVQHFLHRRDPLLAIRFGTRQAKLALTTKRDDVTMLTVWTQVDGIAVGGLTTAQHLLHHFVDGFILRMGPFEVRPPIDKDVLEAVLLLATIWCHLPECRPPSSGCQSAAGVTGRKKEIPMGSR